MKHDGIPGATHRRLVAAASVAVMTIAIVVIGGLCIAPANAAVRQPRQPKAGPGGSATPFKGLRVMQGGSGYDAWEILEPTRPTPPSAPLVIVMHGYYEFSGYTVNGALARHTALKGNIVIYPRWQTGVATPCPGPYDIQPCIESATAAIHSAIAYLHAHPRLVQPRLNATSYFGFSFGGIITADMTNRWKALDLAKPRAIFLDDPHDGGLTGNNEPALDPSLAGIPSTAKFVCHAGADGVISLTDPLGQSLKNASCNAVFPKLGQIPAANKSLVLTSDDSRGRPALQAIHGVCAGPGAPDTTPGIGHYPVDAYDWGFCWRSFDALRACALYGTDCRYALGDTPQNRYVGAWGDGVPIIALKIQTRAPIRPLPRPKSQTKPPPGSSVVPPTAKLKRTRGVNPHTTRIVLAGTASGANGVTFVEVAIIRHAGGRCTQMTAIGTFITLRACDRPRSFIFALGASRWSLRLPARLRPGTYLVFARAIDGFGQTQVGYPPAATTAFTVS
jgi:hypothetical protein